MKRHILLIITFAFLTSGCNLLFRLPVGGPEVIPTEIFPVNEAVHNDVMVTGLAITMAPSNGSLTLAGNADGLATGGIQYNIAEWKPVVTIDKDTLHIEQQSPDNNISSPPKDASNQWDLSLGNTLETISILCQTGNKTLTFADSLPDGVTINVNAGVGNLRLEFPAGVTTNVEIHRGPSSITTEGAWTKDGKMYISGSSGPVWTVRVDIGVGSLTLATQ